MTIQWLAPNAAIVSHAGRMCTFINSSFIEMVAWALKVQRLPR